jgi:hypothetical protein
MEQTPSNTPVPVMESKPGPAGWLAVWIKAVTKPSEQTYIEISESPDARMQTAFIWVFIAGTISGIAQAILRAAYAAMGTTPQIPGLEQFSQQPGDGGTAIGSLVGGICASPLVGLLSVLFFAIGIAITQWIAKLFGGTGNFEKLAYTTAAISVPFTLITSVLTLIGVIPFVGICTGIISLILSLYILYLQITAVKAVNRFGWGPAVGAVLIPVLVVLFVCGCLTIAILTLLGPAIGDVFSGINQSLAP